MTVKAFFAKGFLARPPSDWMNLPQFVRHANVLEMQISEYVDSMQLPELFLYRTVADLHWKPPGQGRRHLIHEWWLEITGAARLEIEWRMVELVAKSLEIKIRK